MSIATFFLRLWGIVPWRPLPEGMSRWQFAAHWYQMLILAIALLTVIVSAARLNDGAHPCDSVFGECLYFTEVMDFALALGSTLGLVLCSSGLQRWKLAGTHDALLDCYAAKKGFLQSWATHSLKHCMIILVMWLGSIVLRSLWVLKNAENFKQMDNHNWTDYVPLVVFCFSSGCVMAVAYSLLHVCNALALMVDEYCYNFVDHADFSCGVRDWNVVQAILRRSSSAVEGSFLTLSTTALAVVLLCLADIVGLGSSGDGLQDLDAMPALLPGGFLALAACKVFFRAASVTEGCRRVPAIVNSLSFGEEADPLDLARQYVVEYITHSAAGFHVRDFRLTSLMAIKLSYGCGVITFGVLTKVASGA